MDAGEFAERGIASLGFEILPPGFEELKPGGVQGGVESLGDRVSGRSGH